mmetsp:Transcript_76083/g.211522  ORF Transcript_76083/g.211522 Transcript_76083/m.211522 type:complete len:593 (+) Transcript_76083:102-1880(+)
MAGSGGSPPLLQLLAGMQAVETMRAQNVLQAVETLRAQNAAAAQNLAAQLQSLAAQAQVQNLVAQRRISELAAVPASPPTAASLVATSAAVAAAANAANPAAAAAVAATAAVTGTVRPGLQPMTSSSAAAAPAAPTARGGEGGGGSRERAKAAAAAKAEEEAAEEQVPRCHLHRKANKACKYCKAFAQSQEEKTKKKEELRSAVLERLKEGAAANSGKAYGKDDKAPVPNFVHFPTVLIERIQKNDVFNNSVGNSTVNDLKNVLYSAETCDTESRAQGSLDLQPSGFICSVYRMLTLQLTEGQLQMLMNSRSCWIRCAGFMYVRLGFHHDRYWELLSDALMDDESFVPFPGRGGETMTVGQYVEQLLTKDKYGETQLSFPRIPVAQRKTINKRMVLYGQFRKRYAANMDVIERFKEAGVEVEVCSPDGEWSRAKTAGEPSPGRRCTTVPVLFLDGDGEEVDVSLGMLITPGGSSSSNDLTRTRGRSTQELLERYDEQQRGAAVASGKDYCKTSGHQVVHVGGVTFVAGVKRKEAEREDADDEDTRARESRRSAQSAEHQAKMAAIESKYCARVAGKTESRGDVDGPERMRLG